MIEDLESDDNDSSDDDTGDFLANFILTPTLPIYTYLPSQATILHTNNFFSFSE